jgi:hypothetical protein
MSTERDELADILLSDALRNSDAYGREYALAEADVILAAGYRKPRTVTTVAELDALPAGSVIRESLLVCIKWGSGSWGTFSGDSYDSSRIDLPVTVLYTPAVTP